ncbi:hypothetical protein HYPSUDRAFT_137776 [Hypholoma sublateritium FD-334 SS-4]|uniref:Uncharacterized protein n=1 Tax=Hypholoma sublateritium (strain FD-334 SS-4) TaxID=945553 RepID=A0A0D2L830_HYPSF|nr:hypothetical protein HYPSUDRAFT_137776 [Hypholoma sublateritium FD-334 SS-4]
MDKIRAQALSSQPKIIPPPDDDERDNGDDSDNSDKKSKMSWGADKVTVQKPMLKGRAVVGTRRGRGVASYGHESSANAKFGTRLVSDGSTYARPASRCIQSVTPTPLRPPPPSDKSPNYARAKITRPAWDTSTWSPIPPVTKRSRNTSAASPTTVTRTPTGPKSPIASSAPSEDFGMGLYRQMLANNPSLNSSA